MPRGRRAWTLVAIGGTAAAVILVLSALRILDGGYFLLQAGWNQAKLLADRVPLADAEQIPNLTPSEREALGWLDEIRRFGREDVGLSASDNYSELSPSFTEPIWNVSAAPPDRLSAHRYYYPIVGSLPYIGYFSQKDALREAEALEALGWETYVRPAGAYSTLGWFRDPLWRSMLGWDRERLTNTLLHELAHASLWLKGHGHFNESWASFVGDQATEAFVLGLESSEPEFLERKRARDKDRLQYRAFMQRLCRRLQGLYGSGLPRDEVLRQKEIVLGEARKHYMQLPWQTQAYANALGPEQVLNNASLLQFQVYNSGNELFVEALERFEGDLSAFVAASQRLKEAQANSEGGFDPFETMRTLGPDPI